LAVLATVIGLGASTLVSTDAEARRNHRQKSTKAQRGGGYAPPFAAIVVDASTGRTMYAVDPDEPRRPASVTKVMTLYLLFEQLERGTLALDSELKASVRAANRAPSKIGIRPGETITVEDSIKALVTKSANDVATVIAENLAGTEEDFAERMTRKARQLGMKGTTFRNASGLPDPEQLTTARDLATLGRAIQVKFPRYYRYFQTRAFNYAGRTIGNHNRLLGRVEGVDGIKTGFTNASGFNLLTSAKTDGRHVVGVVLGGRSGASRDNIMANLIRTHLAKATVGRGATFADASEAVTVAEAARTADPTLDVDTTAAIAPAARPTRSPDALRPAVAFAAGGAATTTPVSTGSLGSPPSVPKAALAFAARTDDTVPLPPLTGQKIEARLPATQAVPARTEMAAARAEPTPKVEKAEKPEAAPARPARITPWVIQLGAAEGEDKARAILDEAKSRSGRLLSHAAPFTEKVVRSGATLFRARFSGFTEADSAQEACRSLKRSGFECFATRS
jgi:D-alanyl-D-alanine carboxypeptidase